MKLEIEGPDGKKYEIEGDGDAETLAKNFTAQMWPNLKSDTGLTALKNTAEISGKTGIGKAVSGMTDLARRILGPPLNEDAYKRMWSGKVPATGDELASRLGVPTDEEAEAKRLGVPVTPNRKAIAKGVEFATGTLMSGGTGKLAALAGAGGAVGERVAGEPGAVALGIALSMLGLRGGATKAAPAKTLDDIKIERKAAYATADSSGAVVSQGSLGRMLQDMHAEMAPKYFAKDTHPKAFQAFRELTEEASKGHVELGRLFKMRGRMGALKGSSGTAGQDAEMIGTMRRVMDNHIVNMQPVRDVIAGDMKGIAAFREGTQLFRREKGLKSIEGLVERAKDSTSTYTAAGYDTALRNQFKAFVKPNTDGTPNRNMRFFTKPEQDAFHRIARGTKVGNAMRQIGRLAPQNILNTLLLANVHPAAASLSVPAMGARVAASKSTQRNIKLAQQLIAGGKPVPPNLRRYLNAYPAAGGVFAGQGSQTKQ
jgi:hypothetical protein